ncbi:retrovirus-related Pol polyprotein from type-1 retrotransposable element R2 [Trichonephila clavipes]|nr:retrovirus-related Pol polyprotein from type-1 retrotransposable element R2 [Trichonephila clavipes]
MRQNAIQRRIKTAVQNIGAILSDNQVIGLSGLRPDLVALIENKLYISDITVRFENRRASFRSAAERKLEKYTPPFQHFNSLDNEDIQIVPIIVGSLGYWDPNNDAFLRPVATLNYLKNF